MTLKEAYIRICNQEGITPTKRGYKMITESISNEPPLGDSFTKEEVALLTMYFKEEPGGAGWYNHKNRMFSNDGYCITKQKDGIHLIYCHDEPNEEGELDECETVGVYKTARMLIDKTKGGTQLP